MVAIPSRGNPRAAPKAKEHMQRIESDLYEDTVAEREAA
jgi:hypothetical protein